jgi:hypothetical protein
MKQEWGNSIFILYSLLAIKLSSSYNYSFTLWYSISQWIQWFIRTRHSNLHQVYTTYWFYTRWNRHKICALWYIYHLKLWSVLTLLTFDFNYNNKLCHCDNHHMDVIMKLYNLLWFLKIKDSYQSTLIHLTYIPMKYCLVFDMMTVISWNT